MRQDQVAAGAAPGGHLALGSPEDVAQKIIAQHKLFNHDRFIIQISVGTMPHDKVLEAPEPFGTKVAPIVHDALGS